MKEEKNNYSFDSKRHIHTLDGKPLTGVTTVLGIISKGDGLIQWSANMASEYIKENLRIKQLNGDDFFTINESLFYKIIEESKKAWVKKRNTAGTQGTDIHAIVEDIITDAIKNHNGYILETKTNIKQIQYFVDWARNNKVKFLESEKNVWSKELWIGGIVDFVCEINGEVFVGDIKTAKSIYPINFWQCSAYHYCLTEMGLYDNIKGYKIIRLGKDELDVNGNIIKEGTFEVGENYSYDDNIEGFKSALTVYRKLNLIS